jgi:hypothetical protein
MSSCRNHYDNLKVAHDAPAEVIEAAYRALCQKYRQTSSRDSVLRVRKIIDSAYFVLSNPLRRLQHDKWIQQVESESLLRASLRRATNGLVASAAIWRARYLARMRPYLLHGAILIIGLVVAWPYFAAESRHESTVQIAGNTRRDKAYDPIPGATLPLSTPDEILPNRGPILFGPKENLPVMRRVLTVAPAPKEQTWVPVGEPVPISPRVSHDWRRFDPDGKLWPAFTGPIGMPGDLGCPQRVGNGLASSTIDNVGNSYDVFVKLVADPDSPRDKCSVTWIFVKARGKYTIDGVDAGQYSIFFRDLFSGTTERTPAVSLNSFSNDREEGGTQYYVTLYARPDGNLHPITISNDAFEAI